jgi:hypothetical protein
MTVKENLLGYPSISEITKFIINQVMTSRLPGDLL